MRVRDIIQNSWIMLKVNFKLSIIKPLLLGICYLLFIPLLHGVSNLEAKYVAEVLEKFVSVVGIIIMVPLCAPELSTKYIKENVCGKALSYGKIIILRILMSIMMLCILISGFSISLKLLHCEFPLVNYIMGTLITAGTIGMIGFMVVLVSNNLISGYIISVGYFMLCWTGIINEGSPMYLFSMINGRLQQKGILLLITGLCTTGLYLPTLYKK